MNTWENMKTDDAFNDDDSICDGDEDEGCSDAKGVWSPDIEQCFQDVDDARSF
jgi:hypothetical protein